MLFKHADISDSLDANTSLARALFDLYESFEPEYIDRLNDLQNVVDSAIDEAIGIARKKCL